MYNKISFILLLLLFSIIFIKPINANDLEYINDKNVLLEAIAEVENGQSKTIYIDRIEYSGPILFNIDDKNITIVGKDSNSGFVNSTVGCIMLTATSDPEKVGSITFQNVSFKTELDEFNPENSYSSTMLYGLKVDSGNINVEIDNCEFSGFRYGKGPGGAIQAIYSNSKNINNKANIKINNTKFTDNVSVSGGAIYIVGTNNVNLNIENSEFNSNYSTRGALFLHRASANIKNSKFINNGDFEEFVSDYTHVGSAVVSLESILQISNSEFNQNLGTSTIYISNSNALISNNTIRDNNSSLTCLIVKNSGTKLVTFFNNLFDNNINVYDRYFNCDKSDTNFETELRTKFYFNTFNNIGSDQDINNDHVYSFANLFINPNVTDSSFPNDENNYNTILNNISEVDSDLNNMIISNDIIKQNITLFNTYIGVFYASQNKFTHEINVDGETIYIDSLSHKDKFGFNFEGYYYDDILINNDSKILISSTGDNNIDVKYKLNKTGVLSFIIAPIALVVIVALLIYLRSLTIKKKKNDEIKKVDNNEVTEINKEVFSCLSEREIEVLNLLLEGKERKQIANDLFVSESTIKKHITSIYTKLDVKNRIELFNKVKK